MKCSKELCTWIFKDVTSKRERNKRITIKTLIKIGNKENKENKTKHAKVNLVINLMKIEKTKDFWKWKSYKDDNKFVDVY